VTPFFSLFLRRLLNGPTGRPVVNLFEWTMTVPGAHNGCCQPHKSASARDAEDGGTVPDIGGKATLLDSILNR